jgi:hypothetical protein
MNAVNIEHAFAHPLGIPEGQRNDVNDADYVRSGKPTHLATALAKVLPRLKQRAASLNESTQMKQWIDNSLNDLAGVQRAVAHPASTDEISQSACVELWSLSAISIRLIDIYMIERCS